MTKRTLLHSAQVAQKDLEITTLEGGHGDWMLMIVNHRLHERMAISVNGRELLEALDATASADATNAVAELRTAREALHLALQQRDAEEDREYKDWRDLDE
ncbi:hypothetical protein [Sinomonas sp.]|uniref:hypothetical protein n=1 Tax=Sinomonas sp. TaxID=1914986 RepID=UPI003F811296